MQLGEKRKKDRNSNEDDRIEEAKKSGIYDAKEKKAAGIDGLPNELWIYGGEGLIKKLTDLIQRI